MKYRVSKNSNGKVVSNYNNFFLIEDEEGGKELLDLFELYYGLTLMVRNYISITEMLYMENKKNSKDGE